MEERTKQEYTFPVENPTKSYWQTPPNDLQNFRSTPELPAEADIVIVGSGISGTSTAWHLLSQDSSLKIVLIEAREFCRGATGRNGGHTKPVSYRAFAEKIARVGKETALKVVDFEHENVRQMHELVKKYNIDCDAVKCPTVDIIYDPVVWKTATDAIAELEAAHEAYRTTDRYEIFGPRETEENFYCAGTQGSIRYPAGSISAYKFTTGVMRLCLERGLNLQTNRPVTSLKKEGSSWICTTPSGEIKAPKVILATNANTPYLLPQLKRLIVSLRGEVTAQRPGSGMPQKGLAETYTFLYKTGYEYMISRQAGALHEGDIIIGGGLTKAKNQGLYEWGIFDDTTKEPVIMDHLRGCLKEYFGEYWGEDSPDGRIRQEWSGIMAESRDGEPLVGPVPGMDGVFVSASFQGHGMVMCYLCARVLSNLVLRPDEKQDWAPECFIISQERLDKMAKMKFGETHFGRAPKEDSL